MPVYSVDRQEKFFEAFVINGTVSHACLAAGISPKTHYRCMKKHERYAERFKQAKEDHNDMLISAAVKRAVVGVSEPVYQNGERVGEKQKYSDVLLMTLLKARIPELFGDKQQISIEGEGLAIVEVEDWYGNKIHSDAEAVATPSGDTP